eukprot:m.53866 g.53866  ORF g.53866 m.53866 type:complete len:238 (+) comp18447_c0_seq2:29-742(+)
MMSWNGKLEKKEEKNKQANKPSLLSSDARCSLHQMNTYMGDGLASLLSPVSDSPAKNRQTHALDLWQLCTTVCPCPDTKFFQLRNIRVAKTHKDSRNSVAMASKVLKSFPRYDVAQRPVYCLGAQLLCRGVSVSDQGRDKILDVASKTLPGVSWNPFLLDIREDFTPSWKQSPSACVAANVSSIAMDFEHITNRVSEMLAAKAYLHWYAKYGLEEADFEIAQNSVTDIVKAYVDAVT